jgi:hypothetical protein
MVNFISEDAVGDNVGVTARQNRPKVGMDLGHGVLKHGHDTRDFGRGQRGRWRHEVGLVHAGCARRAGAEENSRDTRRPSARSRSEDSKSGAKDRFRQRPQLELEEPLVAALPQCLSRLVIASAPTAQWRVPLAQR